MKTRAVFPTILWSEICQRLQNKSKSEKGVTFHQSNAQKAPATKAGAVLDYGEHLLRLRDVKEKTGLGSSTIYRRIADGTFPVPRSLGPNTVRWLQSEIDAWIRSLPSSQGGTTADDAS
jgi:prophage regulatory protein